MSLYRYVDGVDGLLDQVVSRLISRNDHGRPLPTTWREAVISYAIMLRRLLAEHPAYLAAVLRRPIVNRPALRAVDGLIGTLRQAGLTPAAAANSYSALYSFCVGFAALEQGRARVSVAGRTETAAGSLHETLRASRLPHLEEGAAYLGQPFDDARFQLALDVICQGIAASCDQGARRTQA
jgi:hypothetical protein